MNSPHVENIAQETLDIKQNAAPVGAHTPESTDLQKARKELQAHLDRLSRYIIKSARHRVKLVKKCEVIQLEKAIQGEITLSAGSGRLDLVENLLVRRTQIRTVMQTIETLERHDYEKRFGLD